MSEQNKRLLSRYVDAVWNQGNPRTIDESVARDWVGHVPGKELDGPAQLKEYIAGLRTAFPHMQYTVEDTIAEGDRVGLRWSARDNSRRGSQGNRPSGVERTITGITFARLADSKIVESWAESQTGAIL